MTTANAITLKRRERRRVSASMVLSLALHAVVLLLLLLQRPEAGAGLVLAEIDYVAALEPERAATEPVRSQAPLAARPAETPQHFRRVEREADIVPEPQSDYALADRMAARLDALREKRANIVAAASASPVAAQWSAAGVPDPGPAKPAPVTLHRGAPAAAPLSLDRGAPLTTARLEPATVAMPRPEEARSATTATRNLAGARLSGPVADRPIIRHSTPAYPEWAKREAVEGSVTLRFFVRPDGSIKENVLVQKTAGFEDFDQSALTALLDWRFRPLAAGRTGEQWGTITFHFRLREAG